MLRGQIHLFMFFLSIGVVEIRSLVLFGALTGVFLITIIYKVHLKICVLKNFLAIL